jgi:hypothetical protein
VLGVDRDALAQAHGAGRQFGLQQGDAAVEQGLQGGIGQLAQQAGQVAVGR